MSWIGIPVRRLVLLLVLALARFSITQRDLDESNGTVHAGCLYVIPVEE